MAWLFDTDAISEVLRPRPSELYLTWLRTIAVDEQLTTAITVGELYWGACRSPARERHLRKIDEVLLPSLRVLPFDAKAARQFGELKAMLDNQGTPLADADLQIASIALTEGHELVTGNLRHFSRIPGLRINTALAASRPAT
ncbi:MAG TPA: PIN domain-containing protein [Kofleriaceae bacterium]|jgi:predicted nucleic acid-binding protein|nr:PIN domain-containing protein [Kofleriaceae bacterium]